MDQPFDEDDLDAVFNEVMDREKQILDLLNASGIPADKISAIALTLGGVSALRANHLPREIGKKVLEVLGDIAFGDNDPDDIAGRHYDRMFSRRKGAAEFRMGRHTVERMYGSSEELEADAGILLDCPTCGAFRDLLPGNFALVRRGTSDEPANKDAAVAEGEIIYCKKGDHLLVRRGHQLRLLDWADAPSWIPEAMKTLREAIGRELL